MDGLKFMPETDNKSQAEAKAETKAKGKGKSRGRPRKLVIEDDNGCKVVESHEKNQSQNQNQNINENDKEFQEIMNILIQESKPKINTSGKTNGKTNGKTKRNRPKFGAKEAKKDEKLTRVSKDIFDKYKRSGAGKADAKADSPEWIKTNLLNNCRIKANTLYKIIKYYQVVKGDPCALNTLMLSNIIAKPFNFLNAKHQFLSFKKCEFIMEVYKLKDKTDKQLIANGYIFDKFMAENTYYLPQYKYVHQSQVKTKQTQVKNLEQTKSPMFPYRYDILEHDFYETLTKYGIDAKNKDFQFGKNNELMDIRIATNSKRNTFWTTEKFLNLEETYGNLLKERFGDEQKIDCPYKKNGIKDWIKTVEEKINIKLNEQQVKAVNTALRYKLMCISGYPGTGKSTIVDFIVRFRREVLEQPTTLMAPTGKAVKSLMNKLTENAEANTKVKGCSPLIATCHKFVHNIFGEYRNAVENPENEMKDSLIKSYMDAKKNPFSCVIIDEASMMDFEIFMMIMDFVTEFGGSVIFVGDINQLPPVSAGRPYECIYKSGLFKCVELQQIMRSSGNISKFVLSLNGNRFDELENYFDGKEIKYYDTTNFSESYFKAFFKKIIDNEENGLNGFKRNYSVISAQNGGDDGQGKDWEGSVNQLNEIIQGICLEIKRNEAIQEAKEDGDYQDLLSVNTHRRTFYNGDRVIRTVNDYGAANGNIRVNGEMGSLSMRNKIDKDGKEKLVITVNYDDGDQQEVDALDLEDNFNLAYASTVHKMQGSENKNIIVVMSNQHYMWKGEGCKKLLYTAVSRAKEQLSILSFMGAFSESLNNCGKPEKSFHSEFLFKM